MSIRSISRLAVVISAAFVLGSCAPAYDATPIGQGAKTAGATAATSAETTASTPETTPEPSAEPTPDPTPDPTPAEINSAEGGPDCSQVKCVALTFDDGPGEYTAAVLDALKAAGVHGTFFVMGKNVVAHPELVQRAVREGNAVGGHSWDHPQLTKVSKEGLNHQLRDTNKAIHDAIGVTPNFMRPPYGAVNHRVRAAIADEGMAAILWDVDTLDWKDKDLNQAMEYVHQELLPGSIVLMHDIHEVAPQAVPVIVKEYEAKGFHFVTIPQLYAGKQMIPGAKHFNRDKVLE